MAVAGRSSSQDIELATFISDRTEVGMPEPLLLKPTEAAEMLRLSRSRVYELVESGALPSVKVGRFIRVPVEGLRRWVEEHSRTSDHE
jgi:excisionase family DNA binding protein